MDDAATLHLHGDLADLVRRRGDGPVRVPVAGTRSVKDAIESVGVPHTEAGAVTVDGREVGWGHALRPGQQVHVHPVTAVPAGLAGTVQPSPPPVPTRLVADVHLGTLARRLRVLGLDTWWRNDADDPHLAAVATRDDRVLLTRDRGLLMRRSVRHGALVRADDPDEQLVEVVARLGLADQLEPGTRCPRCNGRVDAVPREQVVDQLEPGTRAAAYEHFGRCRDCGQLYWPGAHAEGLAAIADRAS